MTPYNEIHQVDCGGLVMREFVQPPKLHIGRHAHEEPTLLVVVAGSVADRFGILEHQLGPGDLLIRPSAAEHVHRYGNMGAHAIAVSFTCGEEPVVTDQRSLLRNVRVGRACVGTQVLLDELRADDSHRLLSLTCLVAELLGGICDRVETERRMPGWLLRVRDALHDRCVEKPSLHELAALANVSPSHLTRTFRAQFHVSIGQYLRELRIERAESQLEDGRRELAEIALDCGFFDQSHLIRAFQQARRMTPSQWRSMRGLSNRSEHRPRQA